VALTLGLAAAPASAQWSTDFAVEHFAWREHTSPIEVHESGPRLAMGVCFAPRTARGASLAWRGRVYGGSVGYEGSFQFDSTKAISGASTYVGATLSGQLGWRWPDVLDGFAALDVDAWSRRLSKDQRESYRILSARIGVERVATTTSPLSAGGGMRFLLATAEDATITSAGVAYDLSLSPGLGANPFLHAGCRVAPRVTVVGYWDGMRLGRSNQVVLLKRRQPQAVVFQPPTDMDVVGLGVVYGW
jgi:hypothetical protein